MKKNSKNLILFSLLFIFAAKIILRFFKTGFIVATIKIFLIIAAYVLVITFMKNLKFFSSKVENTILKFVQPKDNKK